MQEVLDLCEEAIQRRKSLLISMVNAAKLVNMADNQKLNQAVRSGDICLADGMSVVWALRLLGERIPERVAGIDLMMRLFERADRCRYRVYLLGACEVVVSMVAKRVRQDYPGVQLVGVQHGYFTEQGEDQVAQDIARAQPDILLVAMTSPRKERFLARWRSIVQVPVCHGVGGSFDVMAGKVRRAPAIWQRLGLEWLYRVKQEPRRLWRRYLITNSRFLWSLHAALLARWCGWRRPRARSGVA
jgi:N-acetylglucosaminyldiphosphoundecaprenol N-acetyl-beta-D-mannosaminyltransferase